MQLRGIRKYIEFAMTPTPASNVEQLAEPERDGTGGQFRSSIVRR